VISLAQEVTPNIMETRRAQLGSFLSGYTTGADVVMVVHGSTSHDRASAWFTSDDTAKAGTSFTYAGVNRSHRAPSTYEDTMASAASSTSTNMPPDCADEIFGKAGCAGRSGGVAARCHALDVDDPGKPARAWDDRDVVTRWSNTPIPLGSSAARRSTRSRTCRAMGGRPQWACG
jgi:hypothetical protein